MLELAIVVSKHVFQTIDEGLVHLDCRVTLPDLKVLKPFTNTSL